MLLAIDIGNTNIVLGGFKGEDLLFEFRLSSDTSRTVDEYAALIHTLIAKALGPSPHFSGAIISSVVPPLTTDIVTVIKESFDIQPLVVGAGIKTGIALKVSEPSGVGADRVVNGVALRELYGAPGIVVDFGTATTFDYVNASGEYEGGVISPGLMVSLNSLVSHTAKLPRIELAWPQSVIGKTTVTAMQSGALVGYVSMVDGVISRIEDEVGPLKSIISTGGLGEVIKTHSAKIRSHDPILTLKGMRLIARLNGVVI